MEMNALTRRQADKIEYVLQDLVRDLELVSCLPVDLAPWTRKTCLEAVRGCKESGTGDDDDEEEEDVRSAQLIYDLAARYGDPTDVDSNEVLQQMAEFAELEKELLDAATVVGSVEEAELGRHHALFRAVLDTLHEGGYMQQLPHHPTDADAGVASLQHVVEALAALVTARNRTTVNEDIHNYRILHEAVNKEKTTSADVKALKREYQETKDTRHAEVAALEAEIRQLQEEIEYTRSVVAMELSAFLEVNAKMQEERRVHDAQHLDELRQRARQLDEKLAATVARNQEASNALRTQRAKKEAAVSAAIAEYDAQMSTLQAATAALNKEAEEDTEAIVVLDQELGVLRTEKGEYELEKYIESMRDRHYEDMQATVQKHACTIQACFRAYMTRTKFEQAQSSSKKKGKKRKA